MLPLAPPSKATCARLRKLHTRKGRSASGRFLAEGPKVVLEAFRAGLVCHAVVVSDDIAEEDMLAVEKFGTCFPMDGLSMARPSDFKRLATTQSPQGVVAEFDQPPQPVFEQIGEAGGLLIILDGLQDPGNVGTAVRSAAALGATNLVVTTGSVDLWNPKTVRASAGALFRVLVWNEIESNQLADLLSEKDLTVWTAAPVGQSVFELTSIPDRLAIVFGNESRGVGPSWPDCERICIPMENGVESLNVATAVATILGLLKGKA